MVFPLVLVKPFQHPIQVMFPFGTIGNQFEIVPGKLPDGIAEKRTSLAGIGRGINVDIPLGSLLDPKIPHHLPEKLHGFSGEKVRGFFLRSQLDFGNGRCFHVSLPVMLLR
jgi:hypothetical protein